VNRKRGNWAGNLDYGATALYRPNTLEQLQELVRANRRVKVLGTRHSFNAIADTNGVQISLENLDRVVEIDRRQQTVTVEAGISYGHLCPQLQTQGLALHNLASLPHISIAGACSTATHGSGDRNGNLATAVSALELVASDGQILTLDRGDPDFPGAVVNLGGLGVVSKLTLDLEPAFTVSQKVYDGLPLEDILENIDRIMAGAYSVSLFTDWESRRFRLWLKRRLDTDEGPALDPTLLADRLASDRQHPIAGLEADTCTEQEGVPGPWHLRLPHFRLDQTPSVGSELQSEYFVARCHVRRALTALDSLRQDLAPLLHVSEIRSVAADDLWLSPCYQRDGLALHFTWKKDWPRVSQLLPRIEAALEPFGARPHWGKLFTLAPKQLQAQYEKLDGFRDLLQRHDPTSKFGNAFLERYILEV
jgi:alditol oxidase